MDLNEDEYFFLARAIHAIRTPLVVIQAYLSMVQDGNFGEIPKELRKVMEIINRNTERMIKITNDLHDEQRLGIGRMVLRLEIINVNKFINEIVNEVSPMFDKKNQILRIDPFDNLTQIKVDEAQLSIVLLNILDNASSYTPINGTITISTSEIADMIEVRISDTGIGISLENMEELFKPFPNIFKSSFFGGTGLGLLICKRIIDLHRGRIWAESQGEGKGTTFIMQIPKNLSISL